jgi:hypothetical protein
MRSSFAVLLVSLLSLFLPASAGAAAPHAAAAAGESIPQRWVSLAAKQDVAENDPRVARAKAQLAKAMKATGEAEQAVAAACTRAAGFIFDATRSPATALEVLEALAEKGAGRPMSDTIGRYVAARRNAAGKTHAEAMAAFK